MKRVRSALLAGCTLLAFTTPAAAADPWHGTLGVSSQLVGLGVAMAQRGPVVQANETRVAASGWTVGATASYQAGAPRHFLEAIVQGSKAWTVSDDWNLQATIAHYRYPSHDRASRTLDQTQVGMSRMYRDVFSLNVWGVVPAHGSSRLHAEVDAAFHWPLTAGWSLDTAAGEAQYLAPRHWYVDNRRPRWFAYGHVGVDWNHADWHAEVLRIVSNFRRPRNDYHVAPWVATVTRSF
jgi:hypothetical protein